MRRALTMSGLKRAYQLLGRTYSAQAWHEEYDYLEDVASGSSMDWVRGTFETPYTYTYELRDTGRYGFLLPSTQIIPTAEETLDSVVVIIDSVLKALDDKGSQDEDTP